MNKVINYEKLCFSEVEEIFNDLIDSLKKIKGKKNKDNLASRLIDVNEDMEQLKTRMNNLLIEINTCYGIEVSEKEQERKKQNKRFKKLWTMLGPIVTLATVMTTVPIEEENTTTNQDITGIFENTYN
jgi:hypothetical protein